MFDAVQPFFIRIERDPNLPGRVRLLGSFTADMSDLYQTDSRTWEYFRFHLENVGIPAEHRQLGFTR